METVDALKAKGNSAFIAKDYPAAVAAFTEAIAASGGEPSHVLFSNRSAALASLEKYQEALDDARKCVELSPTWAKGYSRLGLALYKLGRDEDAVGAYEKGLELEPDNGALRSGLADARRALGASGGDGLFGPSFLAKLVADPATRELVDDAEFVKIVDEVRRDPAAMNKHLSDERFQKALSVALGVSIVAGGGGAGGGAGGDSAPSGGGCGGAAAAEGAGEGGSRGGSAGAPPPPSPAAASGGDGWGGGGNAGGEGRSEAAAAEAPEPSPAAAAAAPAQTEEERAAREQAASLKEQGNAHYKAKRFADAIEAYTKASELDSSDITLLTNRAAAKLESGDAAGAAADCDAAVELGRSRRADFKLIAKALARKGAALAKQGDLEAAIACYQKSLTEHRAPDALKRLGEAERELKRRKEEAYVDLEKASEEREKGNEAFQQGRFSDAVKHYTEALARGPPGKYEDAHKLLSNRAACYTKLGAWQDGVKDADACISLKPDFVKGYSRKGHLLFFMKDYDKALETYRAGLQVEPDSAELREGMARCVSAIRSFSAGGASDAEVAERQQRALADPEIQSILQDPVIRQVLQDFQEDPEAARRHAAQPEVMAKVEKLVAAGIVRVSEG